MTPTTRPMMAAAVSLMLLSTAAIGVAAQSNAPAAIQTVAENDNTRPAGRSAGGVTHLRLIADVGIWQPEGPRSPRLRVAAFGEAADLLTTPGPLLRVVEGSEVVIEIENRLAEPLMMRGLITRPAKTDNPFTIPAGESTELRFNAGVPGTYFYWATTTDRPMNLRSGFDSQLGGAFIVDPKGAPTSDRVFVISEWDERRNRVDDTPQPGDPHVFVINGQSWPYTERLREQVGREARWRVINMSLVAHPMHLHGFYFDVRGQGNGITHATYPTDQTRKVVTQGLAVGTTLDMAWMPERAGNWLFHCHVVGHITPTLRFWESAPEDHHNQQVHDAATGMTGLVMGVEVTGGSTVASPVPARAARRLTLDMWKRPGYWEPQDAFGFAIAEGERPTTAAEMTVPGPLLVLKRGEPVEIVATNRLSESTAIHWHGIELESYYDGVPGFSGTSGSITPAMAPGESLTVRFTPPRAGTFMYHTHSHDDHQLASGLYGAIVVLDDGETFDRSRDHVVVIGMQGAKDALNYTRFPVVVNGRTDTTLTLKRGVPNRVRLINITPNFGGLNVSLSAGNDPVLWRPVAKDGANLPAGLRAAIAAVRQGVATGETYDFEVDPPAAGVLWLDIKRGNGEWVQQVRVTVK